jgi:sialate O-acetylesterase
MRLKGWRTAGSRSEVNGHELAASLPHQQNLSGGAHFPDRARQFRTCAQHAYNGSKMKLRTLFCVLFTACCGYADVRLPAVIGDHMLLQRDVPVRVFGKASLGESVTVSYRGQSAQASADSLGRWEVWLSPMKPGAPAEMTIRGNNTIKLADVLVGDVWVGSGQSNMQWAVSQTNNAEQEIASAKFPDIRLFYVPRKPSAIPVDDVDAKWVVCSPESVKDFSAVLYYFGRQLHQDLKVPMGLIHSSWGGTPIASWISGGTLTANVRLSPFLTFWQDMIARYPDNFTRYEQNLKKWEESGTKGNRPAPPLGPGHPHEPTSLYNGMVAPLTRYTIKGALWYQGETEAGRGQGHIYGEALKTLVEDWRRAFGQGDFPFFWVQLANFGNAAKNGHWMKVQEGQAKATALRGTGMAVINDIGEATDIHPKNKQDVGRRLALAARHVAYHENGFVWSSPVYRQFTREASGVRIWFDHAESGLKTRDSGPVKGFVIAGADGKFMAADAKIDGATVLVSSPQVPDPQAVRYAWDYDPDSNLVNSAGLPASLFRTDDRDEVIVR